MVLFTSAAPGKKAAPKAAPRRRRPPQPTQPAPSAQGPSQAGTNPLPTPEPTQPAAAVEDSPVPQAAPEPAKPSDAPASEPIREPEVEQARSEAIQEAQIRHASPKPAPATEKAATPAPTTIQIPETAATISEERQPETETAEAVTRQTAPQPEPPRGVEASTEPAIAGAQQRFEDYYVSQEPAVETAVATSSEQAPPVEAPKSRKSSRRISTAQVLEAASAGAAAPKAKAATKRKAKAAADTTLEIPRPAKRSRRTRLTNFPTPPPADTQNETATTEEVTDAVQGASPAPARRRQPTRKAAGPKRKPNAKSAETIVDSDDENEAVQDDGTPAAEEELEAEEAVQPPRKRQKKVRVEAQPKKPKSRKRKIPKPVAEGDEPEEPEEDNESDPEAHEIDPKTLSMWDLSHDKHHGKMSERGKAMDAINWEAEREKRRAAADLIASGGTQATADGTASNAADGGAEGVVQSTEGPNGTAESPNENAEQTEPVEQADNAEQAGATGDAQNATEAEIEPDAGGGANDIDFMLDDDGNIIADATTLVVDRQADAIAAAGIDRPVEEINDLTTLNNRTTWINENRRDTTDRVPLWKWKSDPWSEEETDEFYDALRMFGTDFLIISKMFPPKTRRMIKAKFVREEKLDPDRVTRALNGQETRKLDLDYYAQKTSREVSIFTKYTSLKDATDKIQQETQDRHAELATAAAQEEQRAAEKRIEESLQKNKQGKKSRKSKKPYMGGMGGFGGGGGPDDD